MVTVVSRLLLLMIFMVNSIGLDVSLMVRDPHEVPIKGAFSEFHIRYLFITSNSLLVLDIPMSSALQQ